MRNWLWILAVSSLWLWAVPAIADHWSESQILRIPEICSATQLWADTIINCPRAEFLPENLNISQTWEIFYKGSGDSVNAIIWELLSMSDPSLPFPFSYEQPLDADIDGDWSVDTTFWMTQEWVPYISWTWYYGRIEDFLLDCVWSTNRTDEDFIVCKWDAEVPLWYGECDGSLYDKWFISLDGGSHIPFREDGYKVCHTIAEDA